MWKLQYQSLWYDELCTMYYSNPELDFSTFIGNVSYEDVHPPLYYQLIKFCFQLFGQTAFVLRFVSVLFGTLIVYVIYCLGKELKNIRVGLFAAALTASNYFLIMYSQEGRAYSLLVLLTSMSFLFLTRYHNRGKLKDIGFYSVSTLALCYTHYYAFFICFAQVVLSIIWIIPKTNKERLNFIKPLILSLIFIFALYIPWISAFLKTALVEEF